MTLNWYQAWERGHRPCPEVRNLGDLDKHEQLLIRRRRARQTQSQLAARMGCSVLWLSLMEQGRAPVARLERYWHEQH